MKADSRGTVPWCPRLISGNRYKVPVEVGQVGGAMMEFLTGNGHRAWERGQVDWAAGLRCAQVRP